MLVEQAGGENPGMVLKNLQTAQDHFTPQFYYKSLGNSASQLVSMLGETGMLGYEPKAQSIANTPLHLPSPHTALELNVGDLNFPKC